MDNRLPLTRHNTRPSMQKEFLDVSLVQFDDCGMSDARGKLAKDNVTPPILRRAPWRESEMRGY